MPSAGTGIFGGALSGAEAESIFMVEPSKFLIVAVVGAIIIKLLHILVG